jgi:hypothetical protein
MDERFLFDVNFLEFQTLSSADDAGTALAAARERSPDLVSVNGDVPTANDAEMTSAHSDNW